MRKVPTRAIIQMVGATRAVGDVDASPAYKTAQKEIGRQMAASTDTAIAPMAKLKR
jgi:hypothetical protein